MYLRLSHLLPNTLNHKLDLHTNAFWMGRTQQREVQCPPHCIVMIQLHDPMWQMIGQKEMLDPILRRQQKTATYNDESFKHLGDILFLEFKRPFSIK